MLLARYFAAALIAASIVVPSLAQDSTRSVDPREFGLDLPAGALAAGKQQAVTTTDDEGQPVVGRIHVRVGDAALILLPDGELALLSATSRVSEPDAKPLHAADVFRLDGAGLITELQIFYR